MIDVTVKTLDSQNHVFNVEEDSTVKQFKETICPSIGIPVDQQRLIFRGRVLQDDKKLSEYSVANNVVHVVQRPANQNNSSNDEPRPNSQAGNLMNDAGLLFADDGTGGVGGRNAIIMGAIGLPTIDIDGSPVDDGQPIPRRSGAAVRLMVGNQMLNRASSLLQQLEDDDAVVAATSATISSSDQNSLDNDSSSNSTDAQMEVDDDSESIERMISQVVNVSSAAALVAAVRHVTPGAMPPGAPNFLVNNNNVPNIASGTGGTGGSGNSANTEQVPTDNNLSPSRRPDAPRLRELATALQDLLALQDRLNPFLRFMQNALRQNRLYTEPEESRSTQFVYDTISSILHMLSHSLHAFSDIMCDFSIVPEDRRLSASLSILVEQSTVVRATIPVAAPAAMLQAAAAANASGGNNINMNMGMMGLGGAGNNNNPGFSFANLGGGGMHIPIPPHVWRNPNIPGSNPAGATPAPNASSAAASAPSNPSQNASQNPSIGVNIQGNILPPGLQNLGALLGMVGPPGMVSLFGPNGPIPVNQASGVNLRPGANSAGNMNMPFNSTPQEQPANASASGLNATSAPVPGSVGSSTAQREPQASNRNPTGSGESNNNNNGVFQQIRNELNRPQFDMLLPCHTHHSSGRSRTNRTRPAEFRRFVNVDSSEGTRAQEEEGEALEIIWDLIQNSSIINTLQPLIKDVLLNYLMRGRDAKNEAHVKTCAKGLVKKILPFFEKFSNKIGNKNDSVDISATYSNLLTEFLSNLIQRALGQVPEGDGQFKVGIFNCIADFQTQLIRVLKICYPNAVNVGTVFTNYFVDQLLGGMSIVFKNLMKQKLLSHVKEIEEKFTDAQSGTDCSVVVYKTLPAIPSVPTSPGTSSILASIPGNSSISSRCAASFNGSLNEPSTSSSPPKKDASVNKCAISTDDVDIDEVLELPPGMTQPSAPNPNSPMSQLPPSPQQNISRRSVGAPGHSNQTDSAMCMMQNLPTEWTETIQQDTRRQMEMTPQPAFSPGYSMLFPRKH